MQIVGRTRELQMIETLLDTIRPGYPTVLHLSGPGGIGKTILLSHLVDRAGQCGYLTLRGRAAEFGTKEAFGLFYDALEPALASLGPRALRRLDEEQRTELAGVFPALKDHSDGHRVRPASGSMDRYRLHRAVAALIDLLASGRPVLLAVDDLHWADPASVELLLYLLRRPPATPLLAAVASRSSQLQPEAAALLEDIHRDSRGIALELAPLTAREAAALFPSDLPSALAERIYTESGGNPFFLMELVRVAHSDEIDVARPVAIADGHVPATVTSAIARECNRVSPTARELIMAAALLGDAFEPELAGEIVSVEHPSALRALDELLRSELVEVADVPGSFRFRHPIVRRAVYDAAGGGWRRAAHARAASILAERGAPAAARAGHVELSATLGDGAAIAVLSEAGYASAPRAPAAAAGWFGTALRLLGDRRDDAQRLELTLAMALALGSAGKLHESRNAFQEVWALLPPDSALRGRAVGAAALIEHLLGKHDEAQALLLSHLRGLDDGDSATAELMLEIAEGCFFSADWDGMRYWAQKAQAVAGLSPIVHAGASASLSLAAYGLEDTGTARLAARQAAAVVDGLSDPDWAARLQSVLVLGWAEYCVESFDEAERHMSRALAVSQTTGQEHLSTAMRVVRAMSNLARGRLKDAAEQAETAIDTSLLSANRLFLTWALTTRSMVEVAGGSLSSAARFGVEAQKTAMHSSSVWSRVTSLYLGEAWLEAGEPKRFRSELLAGDSTPRLPPFPFYAVHAYELLTRAELELGLADSAARWADQATALAERLDLAGPTAEALRAQAALLSSRGSFTAAAELALAAAERAESSGRPIEVGRSRLLAGMTLVRAGRKREAVEQLRRAEECFAAHDSLRYRAKAALELRRLGVHLAGTRGPTPVGADMEPLSRRELMVARLVHEGRANRQIAAELSISVKTVENHLASIFRRLEITSRAQLATLVERSDRATTREPQLRS